MADKLRVPLYKAEKDMEPCTVAVTGATGYVAGALIQRLLASGHSVHATCRNPDNKASIAHLVDLPGAEKRLKFFKVGAWVIVDVCMAMMGFLWRGVPVHGGLVCFNDLCNGPFDLWT